MWHPTKQELLVMENKYLIDLSPQYNLASVSGQYTGKHTKGNTKFCPECGVNISKESFACQKCCSKGERNPFFGKPRKPETIEKIRNSRLSLPDSVRYQPHSDKTKKKMSASRRKKCKPINQIDPSTGRLIKTWGSIVEAVEAIKGQKHTSSQIGIYRACNRTIQNNGSICQTAIGFKWEWA